MVVISVFCTGVATFLSSSSSFILTRTQWTPFQTHRYSENLEAPRIEPGTSRLAARNSDHYTTEAVDCLVSAPFKPMMREGLSCMIARRQRCKKKSSCQDYKSTYMSGHYRPPVFHLKQNIREAGCCIRLHVVLTPYLVSVLFLAANPEVPGSISDATRFSE
jgi:hypothetical protein